MSYRDMIDDTDDDLEAILRTLSDLSASGHWRIEGTLSRVRADISAIRQRQAEEVAKRDRKAAARRRAPARLAGEVELPC